MVANTPLFSLEQIEQFLFDFNFSQNSKSEFYRLLFEKINPGILVTDKNLIQETIKIYENLSERYREDHTIF